MTRLLLTDLRRSIRLFYGCAVVIAVAAAVGTVPVALVDTALHTPGVAALALYAIAGVSLVFTIVAFVVTVHSAISGLIRLRRDTVARWLIVGVLPSQAAGILLGQLIVVAAASAAVGAAVGGLLTPPVLAALLADASGLAGIGPSLSLPAALITAGAVTVIASLSGVGVIRSTTRTPPLRLLTEDGIRRHHLWPRIVVIALLLALVTQMAVSLPASVAGGATQTLLIGPLMLVAAAVTGRPVFTAVLRAWSSVVPAWSSSAFGLARAALLRSPERMGAAVPFVVAIGLPVAFMAGTVVSAPLGEGAQRNTTAGAALILAGPSLLALAGGVAGVRAREGLRALDDRTLERLGASTASRRLVRSLEGIALVITSALLAGICSVVATVIEVAALAPVTTAAIPMDVGPWLVLTLIAAAGAVAAAIPVGRWPAQQRRA